MELAVQAVGVAEQQVGAQYEVVLGVVWPVLLNTVQGAQSVDQIQVDTARVAGLSPVRRLFSVVLPASLPKIFSGMRIALVGILGNLLNWLFLVVERSALSWHRDASRTG